MTDISRRILV